MSIRSLSDLKGLRRIGRIVGRVLAEIEDRVRAGMSTSDLDRLAGLLLQSMGARSTPRRTYGFPGTICVSINDEAVHGVPGQRVIQPGDLVKIDVTGDRGGYVADAARTVAVSPAPDEAVRLAACARVAFERALPWAREGMRARDIGRAVEREVKARGFSVLRELFGHGVGRAIHEPPSIPNYDEPRCGHVLRTGLVITVEPIIAAGRGGSIPGEDGWSVRTADGRLAAHFEETIVITDAEPILLTAA